MNWKPKVFLIYIPIQVLQELKEIHLLAHFSSKNNIRAYLSFALFNADFTRVHSVQVQTSQPKGILGN